MSDIDIVRVTEPRQRRHTGGLYDIPVVGDGLSAVRGFYDDMAPTPEDNLAVTVAKEITRWGSVVVVSAAAATVFL